MRAWVSRQITDAPPLGNGPGPEAVSGPATLVVPPLLRGDDFTQVLRNGLTSAGQAAFGWGLGPDYGPTEKLLAGAEARLAALFADRGPVSLVGLSMGGLFCRLLALRRPGQVRQVVTVCTPFRAPLDSFLLPLGPVLSLWPVPALEALAREVQQPLPVPSLCLYSREDGIVAADSCYDPARPQDAAGIDCAHVAIATDPVVRMLVLERLRNPPQPG
jgi:hypothetical protein